MKVLIVDDQVEIREVLSACLEVESFTPFGAQNLVDAERMFRATSFDVIFLDLNLPDGNGLDFLRMIRKEGVDIPVVVFTGDYHQGFEIKHARADWYVIKPIQPQEFDSVAKLALDVIEEVRSKQRAGNCGIEVDKLCEDHGKKLTRAATFQNMLVGFLGRLPASAAFNKAQLISTAQEVLKQIDSTATRLKQVRGKITSGIVLALLFSWYVGETKITAAYRSLEALVSYVP